MAQISRRDFALGALTAGITIAFCTFNSAAANVALDPNDATAKALGFVPDGSKVDASANPTYKATQKCATCTQYQGKSTDSSAACNIFAGKTVPGAGWCKVWAQRPAA